MKMVVSYLNFDFFIEVKAKSKYRILNFAFQFIKKNEMPLWVHGFCRPPNGDMKQCETHFKDIFSKNSKHLKTVVLARDFNINILDFETNKNVQYFLNLMFRCNMISLSK